MIFIPTLKPSPIIPSSPDHKLSLATEVRQDQGQQSGEEGNIGLSIPQDLSWEEVPKISAWAVRKNV